MNSLQYISTTLRGRSSNDGGYPNQDHNNEIINRNEKGNNNVNETSNDESHSNIKDAENVDIGDDKESNYVSNNIEQKFITRFIHIILFLPKMLIYFPIYYLIFSIVYPFRKAYQFMISFFLNFNSQDSFEFAETSTDEFPTNASQTEIIDDSFSTGTTGRLQPSQTKSPSSKYAPKSSISTILEEESVEFDPDYHEDDDYFKSPSDANPIKNIANEKNSNSEFNESTDENSNNFETSLTNKSLKTNVSKLNYKLLQAINNSTPSLSILASDDDIKQSIIPRSPKQITSNTSPLSSSVSTKRRKKKKYIFPKLLFDFDILNPPNLPRKTLVLDLDETLIHSLSRYNSSSLNKSKGKSIEVKVLGSVPTLYHIYKRPYVEEFLAVVYQWFDLVCFTASIKEYADPVVDYLEQQTLSNDEMKRAMKDLKLSNQPNKIFKKRYYRDSCTFVQGKGYLKDLAVVLNNQPRSRSNSKTKLRSFSISSNVSNTTSSLEIKSQLDYSKIVIIDNSPISFSPNKENGLMIEGWINDPDDLELMNLLPLLHSLRFVSDVRCILGLKDGQRAFTYS